MPDRRPIEIRCPIYGFIPLDGWEHEIIAQSAFQRLRRIRQLAWTDYVYPAAMHTRFEHSLGVMHMATQIYDGIAERSLEILKNDLGYEEAAKNRYRKLVRIAALLHDVGHGPFSHAVEDLAPQKDGEDGTWQHEEYSTAIIRRFFKDVIENHKANSNYRFTIEEVAGLIEGGVGAGQAGLWRDLISGQLDADRMDYLLRDSYHSGVEYGRYDWRRIAATAVLVPDVETGAPRIGVAESGRHAAEALIIARYMMFNQVYFHKTRGILDYHLHQAVGTMLPGGRFPRPVGAELEDYLAWDDWRVLGNLSSREGGDHGNRLLERNFYRLVWETSEFPDQEELEELAGVNDTLDGLSPVCREAGKSWYKVGAMDPPIVPATGGRRIRPLSQHSTIVGTMKPTKRVRFYVAPENRGEAERRLERLKRGLQK